MCKPPINISKFNKKREMGGKMTRTNQGGKYLERVRTRLLTSKHLICNKTENTHIQL